MRFDRESMKDLNRNVLGTLQNSFRFFKMYADIDGWQPMPKLVEPKTSNVLDTWIIARLNQTIVETTRQADVYHLAHAIMPIFELIDDMSNWFIRRSRRRFWKSGDDTDKRQAYIVLHYVLARTMQLLAPWAPYISDDLWRQLMKGTDEPVSVHLSDWPKAGKVKKTVIENMSHARDVINQGLAQRAAAGIKVRQPLAKLTVPEVADDLKVVVAEEVNVKEVVNGKTVKLDTKLTNQLKAEGIMRDLVRHIQNLRKTSGLNVDDRIVLHIESDDALVQQAVTSFGDVIKQETLAVSLSSEPQEHAATTKVEGVAVKLSLTKARS
jgi:isoleucyl-tRNA synthetase